MNLVTIGLGNVEVKTFGDDSGILIRTDLQEIPTEMLFQMLFSTINELIEKHSPGTVTINSRFKW